MIWLVQVMGQWKVGRYLKSINKIKISEKECNQWKLNQMGIP